MNIEKELLEILGREKISHQKMLRIVRLIDKVQTEAYGDGFDDGAKDKELELIMGD